MNKFLLALAVVALLVSVGAGYLAVKTNGLLGAAGYGSTHYQTENFLQGLYAGTTGQTQVTNGGAVLVGGTATSTIASSNLLLNSTSTGIVIRATNGGCYRLSTANATSVSFSTSSCN